MLGREEIDRRRGEDDPRRGDDEGLVFIAGPPGAGDGPANVENAKLRRVLSGLVVVADCDEMDPCRRPYLRGSGVGEVGWGETTRTMVSVLED